MATKATEILVVVEVTAVVVDLVEVKAHAVAVAAAAAVVADPVETGVLLDAN